MFFVDAVKCFNKLWLKECLLQMYNLGHDPNTSKETDIIMRTPAGNTVSNNLFLIFICLKAFSK